MNATSLARPSLLVEASTSLFEPLRNRLDLVRSLDQHARLLQVQTALPDLTLVAERMVLRESVSQPFELQLHALSTSAHLELKLLLGEQMSVRLLHSDGQYVPWHGYVHAAAQLGANGGLARYTLTMRPWLANLALRHNSRVFHDMTAQQVLEAVFANHHPQAHWRFEVTQPLRTRSLCTQYQETDLAFVQRLLAEEGLSYHFEHLDDRAASEADQAGLARHVLVLADRHYRRPSIGRVRFAQPHESAHLGGSDLSRDGITAFMAQRQVAAHAVTLGSWDYKRLHGLVASDASALPLGELPLLEVYDGSGAYRYQDPEHAQQAAEQALLALELDFKRFEGQGSVRALRAGSGFELIDHPLYGANTSAGDYSGALLASHQRATQPEHNAFTVLAIEHHCANNLGADLARLLGGTEVERSDIERGSYRNHFHCAPAAAAVVPRLLRKPTAWGTQSATVVGLSDEPVETERDHRIKVRLPWQDISLGTQGEGQASGDAPQNAPGTWVRVALPWAGANWGAVLAPRIGAEVAIEFVEGDIDRPVVVGGLYNGADTPPFAAGEDAGVNHGGVLSGWHTHTLGDQSGFNQWVIDDATGQLRMRLACSYSLAEVGLGHLIGQHPASAQRGAWRGSGFEASAQGWGVLRASQGLLISTSLRAATYGSAQGTQLDASEALAQLKGAHDLGQRLSEAALAGGALAVTPAAADTGLAPFITEIDPAQEGSLNTPLNGQSPSFDPAGEREGSTPVHCFAQPVLLLDTPASLTLASDAGIAQYAGEHLSHISQGDVQISAAHTAAQVSGQTSSLYTHAGGLQIKAANGPLSLRAHTDTLQLLANKDIQILSVGSEITLSANSKIELIAADSGITLDGGNVTFTTPGTWDAKGALKELVAGASGSATLPALPEGSLPGFGPFIGSYALMKTDGRAFQGYRYRIVNGSTVLLEGDTSHNGETGVVATVSSKLVEAQKTIMRNDQRITEIWQGYLSSTLPNAQAPEQDPIPEDYVAQTGGTD